MSVQRLKLHITLYPLPDGMHIATCAEIPMCQILRQSREHAFTDAKIYIKRFLAERAAEGRPFELPDIREVEF